MKTTTGLNIVVPKWPLRCHSGLMVARDDRSRMKQKTSLDSVNPQLPQDNAGISLQSHTRTHIVQSSGSALLSGWLLHFATAWQRKEIAQENWAILLHVRPRTFWPACLREICVSPDRTDRACEE